MTILAKEVLSGNQEKLIFSQMTPMPAALKCKFSDFRIFEYFM